MNKTIIFRFPAKNLDFLKIFCQKVRISGKNNFIKTFGLKSLDFEKKFAWKKFQVFSKLPETVFDF